MTRKFAITLCLITCCLFLLSCSSSDDETSAKTGKAKPVAATTEKRHDNNLPPTPYQLLSPADIKAFFPNATIKITSRGEAAKEATGTRIYFFDLDENDMKFIQIAVTRTRDMNPELIQAGRNAQKIYNLEKGFVQQPQVVENLGRHAYYGGSGLKPGAGLHVLLDRDTAFTVAVALGRGNDDQREHLRIERALAQKIIHNLSQK